MKKKHQEGGGIKTASAKTLFTTQSESVSVCGEREREGKQLALQIIIPPC